MSRQEGKQKKEPFFTKGFWIALIISFLVACSLGAAIGLIEYFSQSGAGLKTDILAIAVDCAALSGLLLCLIFLLQLFSSKGAFDFLAYSMKTIVYTVFKPHFKQQGFPATYYDYKVLKDGEKRKPIFAILMIGGFFLLIGIILYIIYKTR